MTCMVWYVSLCVAYGGLSTERDDHKRDSKTLEMLVARLFGFHVACVERQSLFFSVSISSTYTVS